MKSSKSLYRQQLPQLGNGIFITDAGLETVFIFQKQVDLPMFAAFDLLKNRDGVRLLTDYYLTFVNLALENRTGLILDTATWRASAGWGEKLGYTAEQMWAFNLQNVEILQEIRAMYASTASPMVINGAIGPQDDGYNPTAVMDADAAQAYHSHQVDAFAASAADMVSAATMTYVNEAIGVTRAALQAGIPAVISFTVEVDGRLPDGTTLQSAIAQVDAATDRGPVYYMVNCAHPTHFNHVINADDEWTQRIRGVRANASQKSHAELDEAVELDDGDPVDFGRLYGELKKTLRNLNVVGGCCGTDHRHVGAACRAVM